MGRGAAAQGHQLDVGQGAGETTDLGGHLIRQLAGRTEHQRLHGQPVDVQLGQQTQAEGRGLAAAGFRLWRSNLCRRAPGAGSGPGSGVIWQIAQAGEVVLQGGGEVQAAKFAVVHKRTLCRKTRNGGAVRRGRIIPECAAGCGEYLNGWRHGLPMEASVCVDGFAVCKRSQWNRVVMARS